MPYYRRWRKEGGIYFLTLVTHAGIPILTRPLARQLLRHAFERVRQQRPFEQIASVLLPDHIHLLWRHPQADTDYSRRISAIKQAFTRDWVASGGPEASVTSLRRPSGHRGVWQKRFYEHTIRDYKDFRRHLDYIHISPVKHGLADRPRDWPWSSFGRYVKLGTYEQDWMGHVELPGGVEFEPDEWWPGDGKGAAGQ
ncbi:MAG: REP-associated tyrosine transposase [Planctomycetota bacterium]|jgi:putative transposase